MNGFQRRAEGKKEAIRGAAIELFSKYGVSKVSVREIADAAGVSPVSVYNYFGNKAGLIRAVVESIVSERVTSTRSVLESDRPFPEKLRSIILMKSEGSELLQGEFLESLYRQSPESEDVLKDIFGGEIRNLMEELFRQGRESGHIDPAISPAALFAYMDIFRQGTRQWATASPPPERGTTTAVYTYSTVPLVRQGQPGREPPADGPSQRRAGRVRSRVGGPGRCTGHGQPT